MLEEEDEAERVNAKLTPSASGNTGASSPQMTGHVEEGNKKFEERFCKEVVTTARLH